jgi:hypothetical protein
VEVETGVLLTRSHRDKAKICLKKFPIQNGLKQRDALSSLLLNFDLECAIRRVQENQEGLKLNGTHQLLAYADTIQKNTKSVLDASKEVGLEANSERTKYMLTSRKKVEQKHSMR